MQILDYVRLGFRKSFNWILRHLRVVFVRITLIGLSEVWQQFIIINVSIINRSVSLIYIVMAINRSMYVVPKIFIHFINYNLNNLMGAKLCCSTQSVSSSPPSRKHRINTIQTSRASNSTRHKQSEKYFNSASRSTPHQGSILLFERDEYADYF